MNYLSQEIQCKLQVLQPLSVDGIDLRELGSKSSFLQRNYRRAVSRQANRQIFPNTLHTHCGLYCSPLQTCTEEQDGSFRVSGTGLEPLPDCLLVILISRPQSKFFLLVCGYHRGLHPESLWQSLLNSPLPSPWQQETAAWLSCSNGCSVHSPSPAGTSASLLQAHSPG